MLIQVGHRFVAAGQETEWEEIWQQLTRIAEQGDGFVSARLLRSTEHRSKYTLINEWQDEANWSAHFHLPEVQELTQRSYRLFSGPPLQEWFTTIDAVTKRT